MLAHIASRPPSHPSPVSQPKAVVALAIVAAALMVLSGCTDDPGAPWNTPTYQTTYCESCDIAESALGNADYGPAKWVQSPNYSASNRGVGQIKLVVVHTVQGSYNGCISWFQNTSAKVSAHFVISKTGDVTQMVKEKDIGWHVGSENGYTVGIEHEGYVSDANYVTPQMLDASAKLTCYLLKKYQLPASKAGVKGHVELPKQTHTDPGQYWPWASYLAKIQQCVDGSVGPTCPTSCDDGVSCTDDSCVAGNCVHSANTGAICWDGDACTAGEKCSSGKCVGGKIVKDCNDNNACTSDGCTAGNCTHANSSAACSDGNDCTVGDACSGGSCKAGSPKNCDDGDPCTTGEACVGGSCKPGIAKACDDGNACTTGDVCSGGTCKPGVAKNCNDNNPCTTDSCTAGACKNQPITGACNDGNPCTVGEVCGAAGSCGGGTAKLCMDDNPCTTDSCVAGTCVYTPISGQCDDGDPCSTGDYCAQGLCLAGQAKTCDDDLACTVDSCVDGECKHLGTVKPATKSCEGTAVATADPCGGPAKVEACPADMPCKNGSCGGTADASTTADASIGPDGKPASDAKLPDGGDPADPDGTALADIFNKPPSNQMKVTPDSGCSSRTSAPAPSPSGGLLAGCSLLLGAWWWRRRQG